MALLDPAALTGRVVSTGVGLLGTVVTLPSRVLNLVGDAELLMARAAGLADAAEVLVARIDVVAEEAQVRVDAVRAVTEGAATVVAGASDVTVAADGVVVDAAATTAAARSVVETSQALVATTERLMHALAPAVERGAPMLQRFVEELEPHELDSMIHLVDALPALVQHLREDVMPILVTLDRVGPDIHQLLEVTEDLRQAVNGLPGLGFLTRRGADKEARDEAPLSS